MPDLSATGVWPEPAEGTPQERPIVPGYELLDELGRGGMGVVYKARHGATGRTVALKLIRDGALAGPQERARFRVEAAAATRVRHPNVVEVFEVGEFNGLPYFAMELLEGGSLDRHLAGTKLSPTQAAELTHTLALAVQHAHSLDVIHRDLKPANILLSSESGDPGTLNLETVKIADFGLAKRLDGESTALTRDGAVLGTLGYMAPEQAAGRVRELGPAVDVYALGAVFYEMLAGRPPFEANSRDETVEQVLHEEPVPPTRGNGNVPRDLETVCLKCLEKDPTRRYASAGELAADLERFLSGSPVAAVPVGEWERIVRLAAQDGYENLQEIGRGPCSVVYRAVRGPFDPPVALKVFRSSVCTQADWDARLRQSAAVRAGLSHPNLVPVRGAGWWDDRPYVAVDFVPQGSLDVKPDGRLLPIRRTLQLVEQVGEVVGYLHRQGVVHGNLKPSNVLFAPAGIPRVVDIHFTGGLFLGDRTAGTGVEYLAPELIADPELEPRQNVDVYGLGLILYGLLTGRPLFSAASTPELLDEVRWREPTPPSQFNPEVVPALDSVCLRCLRKNPWQRFTRVFDLVKQIRQLLGDPASNPIPPI